MVRLVELCRAKSEIVPANVSVEPSSFVLFPSTAAAAAAAAVRKRSSPFRIEFVMITKEDPIAFGGLEAKSIH